MILPLRRCGDSFGIGLYQNGKTAKSIKLTYKVRYNILIIKDRPITLNQRVAGSNPASPTKINNLELICARHKTYEHL
jgi:hypothetical protein